MTIVYLCSFASPDLNLSVKRFFDQAKQLKFYEEIKIFGENDLSDDLKIRIKSFKYPIKSKRLFGYACWKPYIIKKYLSSLPANSVLQYSDIGSHFNINGIQRLKEYIEISINDKSLTNTEISIIIKKLLFLYLRCFWMQ